MTEIFNNIQTQVPYTAPVTAPAAETTVKNALPAASVAEKQAPDTVEISNKKEKKGIIAGTKNMIANFKKFFATTGAYINGTVKGITSGAVAGSLIYTAGSIVKHFSKKNIPTKAFAAIGAGVALAANLWNASLNATESKSEIDHRYIGHKN